MVWFKAQEAPFVVLSLTLQTTFNQKMEEPNPYYDYAFKWIDFAIKYNSALLDASSKAFETFLSARQGTAQNIEKTIRSSFNTTLRDDLNENAGNYSPSPGSALPEIFTMSRSLEISWILLTFMRPIV
jgi:hypothetical protein